jgi:hypothetical protein
LEFSDVVSIVALIVSLASASFSAWFGLRDRARIKTDSTYFPASEDSAGPPGILIRIANHGRRPVYLKNLYYNYGGREGSAIVEGFWESEGLVDGRLAEGRDYEHFINSDDDTRLRSENGLPARDIFFEDSLARRHYVKHAREHLRRLFRDVPDA